nr:immunoglobulin heavy chain junction region [Mus musculus]MBK4189224.1 immunoglobulin heavy chain junction region [Mus musculus]MBK4189225.1 immunoglobulin heavy chain junction region [Mus musculus]MBK4189226.1 immunoglobulin heavy chain junction region [Mus musculus]MBK4189227.1 immunoglobulin heavy chain junction region [Mus musculus]
CARWTGTSSGFAYW